MDNKDCIIALKEEIGNPALFVGRKKELEYLLYWAEKTKMELSQSTAIFSRRKKGKTALIQRLYNILYAKNDPQIIPFYFKIKEGDMTQLNFSELFYKSLLGQYFAFIYRETEYIRQISDFEELKELAKDDKFILKDIKIFESYLKNNNSDLAWEYAREAGHRIASEKDVRIIQIIDEFQFLNKFFYHDNSFTKKNKLARFYQATAESKVSPQLITGSYIGWLQEIIGHMVARYKEWELEGFTDEEALDAVYNYSNIYQEPITDFTASLIAKICVKDPFYIASIFTSLYQDKDLTDHDSVIATFDYETSYHKGKMGYIAKIWLEYIWDAFDRVNDKNAKKIVLYLAKHGEEERTRDQIRKDLNLKLTDKQLETRLLKLVKADIIARGNSNFKYRGLGDKVFEIVFRKIYEEEIERIGSEEILTDIHQEIISLKNKVSYHKGLESEYRAINFFLIASLLNKGLEEIVNKPIKGYTYQDIESYGKHRFYLNQKNSIEVDLYLKSKDEDACDYIVEVKNKESKVFKQEIEKFIKEKKLLEKILNKKTGFIFYSIKGVTKEQEEKLWDNGIMLAIPPLKKER